MLVYEIARRVARPEIEDIDFRREAALEKPMYLGVYRAVGKFQAEHGRGPTRDELRDVLEFKPYYYLVNLETHKLSC